MEIRELFMKGREQFILALYVWLQMKRQPDDTTADVLTASLWLTTERTAPNPTATSHTHTTASHCWLTLGGCPLDGTVIHSADGGTCFHGDGIQLTPAGVRLRLTSGCLLQ